MTDKLKGIEPGQRVRVTFDGAVRDSSDHSLFVLLDGSPDHKWNAFPLGAVNAPSFKIEPIEEPITATDRVNVVGSPCRPGVVLCIDGEMAWIRWDGGLRGECRVGVLERVK